MDQDIKRIEDISFQDFVKIYYGPSTNSYFQHFLTHRAIKEKRVLHCISTEGKITKPNTLAEIYRKAHDSAESEEPVETKPNRRTVGFGI